MQYQDLAVLCLGNSTKSWIFYRKTMFQLLYFNVIKNNKASSGTSQTDMLEQSLRSAAQANFRLNFV